MTTQSLDHLKKLYIKASKAYYNTDKTIMSDADFDNLEAKIRKAEPKWEQLAKTGIAVANKKTKAKLEKFMPSLNKIYPDKLPAWLEKHHKIDKWVVMAKLDGSSIQLTYDNGQPSRLLTRGDGVVGGNISFLIPFINNFLLFLVCF